MSIFDKIKNLVSGAQSKLPENMNRLHEQAVAKASERYPAIARYTNWRLTRKDASGAGRR